MSIKFLTCAEIGNLDNGLFGHVVDAELRKLLTDIDDRGADGQKRTITIEIAFTKDVSRDPKSPVIHVDPSVKIKVPAARSGVTVSKIGANGQGELGLMFRDDNAENPEQGTIYDNDDEREGK